GSVTLLIRFSKSHANEVVPEEFTSVAVLPLLSYVYVVLGVEVSSFEVFTLYGETPRELSRLPTASYVMPGQLTAYDTGALWIETLRREAQAKLGSHFDLRKFNRAVLEEGSVPLGELRSHVEDWIAAQARAER
ncbi:MAG: DUF885 family protein, partial [Candidatus Acidiferrum sp.]